jgi:rhomboid protease GluP
MTNQPPPLQDRPTGVPPTHVPVIFKTSKDKPVVTYVIMGVTVLVYLIQMLSIYLTGHDWPSLLGQKSSDLILQGQVWRLITPVLLHASLLHIGFNMYALFVLGPGLERYYGHKRFLVLYLVSGYTGNVLSFLLTTGASIGASTAIFGLVAAETIFIIRNRMLFGSRARPMLINMALVVAVNLILGLQPGIDNWGHLGGLAGGLIFSWLAGPHYKVQPGDTGLELKDVHNKNEAWWGFLWSAGLFTAIVIGKFLIK